MAPASGSGVVISSTGEVKKKPVSHVSLGVGAFMQMFEVTTLGQPFEVLKTHMAAHRGDNLRAAITKTWQRGGIAGFYQGLIPWAWIEASTKGAVLMLASSEAEYQCVNLGLNPALSSMFGGMFGGVAQAYTTMGFSTFMKTVEVTRHKTAGPQKSTFSIAADVLRKEGIAGLNRGVSAVAIRQMTNWGSRFGIARFTESLIKGNDQSRKLTSLERIGSSVIAGALACWNQPIEVIRVEMQSWANKSGAGDPNAKPRGLIGTANHIYQTAGPLGFYRGVTPRVALSVYLTVCMVFGGDELRGYLTKRFDSN